MHLNQDSNPSKKGDFQTNAKLMYEYVDDLTELSLKSCGNFKTIIYFIKK